MAFYYPRYRILLIALPILTALSRIYIGVHYPSDVLAGALIGMGGTAMAVILQKNIEIIHKNLNKARDYIIRQWWH